MPYLVIQNHYRIDFIAQNVDYVLDQCIQNMFVFKYSKCLRNDRENNIYSGLYLKLKYIVQPTSSWVETYNIVDSSILSQLVSDILLILTFRMFKFYAIHR